MVVAGVGATNLGLTNLGFDLVEAVSFGWGTIGKYAVAVAGVFSIYWAVKKK